MRCVELVETLNSLGQPFYSKSGRSFIVHDLFIIFRGKRHLRQSIDYVFNTTFIFLEFFYVHDLLNISYGKRRLRERTDDIFKLIFILF